MQKPLTSLQNPLVNKLPELLDQGKVVIEVKMPKELFDNQVVYLIDDGSDEILIVNMTIDERIAFRKLLREWWGKLVRLKILE